MKNKDLILSAIVTIPKNTKDERVTVYPECPQCYQVNEKVIKTSDYNIEARCTKCGSPFRIDVLRYREIEKRNNEVKLTANSVGRYYIRQDGEILKVVKRESKIYTLQYLNSRVRYSVFSNGRYDDRRENSNLDIIREVHKEYIKKTHEENKKDFSEIIFEETKIYIDRLEKEGIKLVKSTINLHPTSYKLELEILKDAKECR